MKILIYKRTHIGDPDKSGCFGTRDCMGKVRGYNYEAVIGVGGIGSEPKDHEINGKVNWIGINPIKINCESCRGPLVIFKQFIDYGKKGILLKEAAPMLAKRLYENKARFIIGGMSKEENNEAQNIVALAIKQAKRKKEEDVKSLSKKLRTKCIKFMVSHRRRNSSC
jgi:hypothetical protein